MKKVAYLVLGTESSATRYVTISHTKGAPAPLECIVDHNKGKWQHLRSSEQGL